MSKSVKDEALSAAGRVAEGAAEAVIHTVRRDPVLITVLLLGAIAMCLTMWLMVGQMSSALQTVPTREEVKSMFEAHSEHPHPHAVSRTEFKVLSERIGEMRDEMRALNTRIDRLLVAKSGG